MQTNISTKTRMVTILGVLSAIAFLVMVFIKIPVLEIPGLTLKYEPKDVIIAIGGFLYGPLASLSMAVVVALVEMVTVSETGIYGAVMNALSSSVFACTAAFVYMKWRKLAGAATGLICGVVITVPVMLLWNYLMVPIYTGAPRPVVAGLLLPFFLPFNLLKYGLSAAVTMILYKPIRVALDKSHLLPIQKGPDAKPSKISLGALIISLLVVVTCVLYILSSQGII